MEFCEFAFENTKSSSEKEGEELEEEVEVIESNSSQTKKQDESDQEGMSFKPFGCEIEEDAEIKNEQEDEAQIAMAITNQQKRAFYSYILQNQMVLQSNILLLGEIMLDLNIFGFDFKNSELALDYPWNMYRPASKIQNFQDGSLVSYHDSTITGKLFFFDTLQMLYNIPDKNAHNVALKLDKYQNKIIKTIEVLDQLKQHYSQEDLVTIFTEIQNITLEKAMRQLEEYDAKTNSIYMYGIQTINPTNLLPTPFVIGQSQKLVEILGGKHDAYKHQMLRKGFMNFSSLNSHLQLLLISIGVEKKVFIEGRTIEGFSLPMNIIQENYVIHSVKLNPIDYSFNTILTIYNIDVNPNIINNINHYRQSHSYEGLPDDLSYMLDCQIFLQKHYQNQYDLSSERRCHYKLINQKPK